MQTCGKSLRIAANLIDTITVAPKQLQAGLLFIGHFLARWNCQRRESSANVWMPLALDPFHSKCSRSTTAGARYETLSAGPLGRRSDVPCAPRTAASEAAVRSDRVLCEEKILAQTQPCQAGTPGAQMQFHATSMELLRSPPTDSTSPSLPKAVLGSYHRRRGSSLPTQASSLRGARPVQEVCEECQGNAFALCPKRETVTLFQAKNLE